VAKAVGPCIGVGGVVVGQGRAGCQEELEGGRGQHI
jgi:hypothetical protein